MTENKGFHEDFFTNMQIDIILSAHTHCGESWRDIDYLPEYNKFYLIEDGEGWLKIGDIEYYPKAGQMVLMPAGVQQSYSSISSNTFRKYWCHFTLQIGDVNLFDIIDIPYIVDVENFGKLKKLFKQLVHEQNSDTLYARLREKALLIEIVANYLEIANIHELRFFGASSLEKFKTILSYIRVHINEEISVEELAGRLHYNPNYFTRLFKKYTGMPPTQYIRKIRLDKAKVLLKTTDLQVSEIAIETGFCDIYYFSKSFKSYTGFSPTDYRMI